MSEIRSGTEIINAASGKYLCSRVGRWTIYAMTEAEQESKNNRLWYLDGTILKNVAHNTGIHYGVHWEINGGRNVMREKSDKECDHVEFLPVTGSKITVQTDKDIIWIARNMTNTPSKTTLSKTMTEEVTTEVMRASFRELSTKVEFSASTQFSSGGVPLTPSVESTASFTTELAQRFNWESKVTTTTKKAITVEQGTMMLEPWTGKAFEQTTWTFRLNDKIPLMIKKNVSENTYMIDKRGKIVA